MPSPDDRRSLDALVVSGLATYLAGLGLASWDEWGDGERYTRASRYPTYAGPSVPSSPDELLVITPGSRSRQGATTGITAQLRLRGLPDDGQAAGQLSAVQNHAQDIIDALYPGGRPLVPPGGLLGPLRNVGRVSPEGDTLPIARDGARRWGYILNVRLRLRWIR